MSLRSTIVTRSLAAALAVGLSFGVAACGNEGSAKDAGSSSNADSGSGSGSGAGSGSSDTNASDTALTKDDIMSAAYNAALKAKSAHITMTMSGKASMDAAGDVAYGAHQPTMTMTMSMPQTGKGKTEMRFVDGILYMQIPGMTPPGKFLAINPKDKNSPYGKAFSGMTDQLDPLHSIQSMEKAVESAKFVGKETVDGEQVNHYTVVVDTKALLSQLGAQAAQQVNVPKTVTYQMWLDDKNLLRQMTFEIVGVSFKANMSDWGKPVKVEKPASSDIAKAPGAPQA